MPQNVQTGFKFIVRSLIQSLTIAATTLSGVTFLQTLVIMV